MEGVEVMTVGVKEQVWVWSHLKYNDGKIIGIKALAATSFWKTKHVAIVLPKMVIINRGETEARR
jgi:D-lyxose ketol-isomerase